MAMLDIYAKLAVAEDEIREGKVMDADYSIKSPEKTAKSIILTT